MIRLTPKPNLTVSPGLPVVAKHPAVYILANKPWGSLYPGVTSNLRSRVYLHKHGLTGGFTAKYHVHRLVYYELCNDMYSAISREKQLKSGSRKQKLKLICAMNPEWADLYEQLF